MSCLPSAAAFVVGVLVLAVPLSVRAEETRALALPRAEPVDVKLPARSDGKRALGIRMAALGEPSSA